MLAELDPPYGVNNSYIPLRDFKAFLCVFYESVFTNLCFVVLFLFANRVLVNASCSQVSPGKQILISLRLNNWSIGCLFSWQTESESGLLLQGAVGGFFIELTIFPASLQVVIIMSVRLWLMGGSMPLFSEQDNPASFSPHLLTRSVTYTHHCAASHSCWHGCRP